MKKLFFKIFLISLFLSGMIFSQELTGDNPYKAEFKKDPLNYRSLPMVFYRDSDSTYWSPVHVDGVLVMQSVAYDSSLGANDVIVLNSSQYHYTAPIPKTETNTAVADSMGIVFDMQSYPTWSIMFQTTGDINYQLWWTNISDASETNVHDGNWINISAEYLGDVTGIDDALSGTKTTTPFRMLKLMVWIVTSDATNEITTTLIKGG